MIIKDKIIRETLKNWASINDISEVKCEIFDYDYGGVLVINIASTLKSMVNELV